LALASALHFNKVDLIILNNEIVKVDKYNLLGQLNGTTSILINTNTHPHIAGLDSSTLDMVIYKDLNMELLKFL
jgi:hypothetical protein